MKGVWLSEGLERGSCALLPSQRSGKDLQVLGGYGFTGMHVHADGTLGSLEEIPCLQR